MGRWCTVGNGMVQTSLFSFQGWVALLFIALGVGVAAKLWLKPDQPYNPQDAIPRWAAGDGHEVTQFEARGDAGWVIAVKRRS